MRIATAKLGGRIVAAFAIVAALAPSTARAYCLAGACPGGSVAFCDGEDMGTCAPVRWKTGCVGFSIQKDGGGDIDFEELSSYANAAFDTWKNVDCDGNGARPGFFAIDMGKVNCNKVEYNKSAANQNVIMIRTAAWPHPHTAGHDIALTTTTFDPKTGELLDADMELNLANFQLTTSDNDVQYDLASVLTHETGHFLGMQHSTDPDATMRPYYDMGQTDLRDLSPDDVAGICALYPPDDSVDNTCNPLGRHGFSPDCLANQTEGDCAFALGEHSAYAAPVALGVFAMLLRVRRSQQRRSQQCRSQQCRSQTCRSQTCPSQTCRSQTCRSQTSR